MSHPEISIGTNILIVDDDGTFSASLVDLLRLYGYTPSVVDSADAALRALQLDSPRVALIDIRLGMDSGFDVLTAVKRVSPDLACIMMTAHVATRSAIAALRQGAYDYIDKGCEPAELLAVLARALEWRRLLEDKQAADDSLLRAKQVAEAANRAKSEFLAMMSHELRTPLNAIIGFSELILSGAFGPIGNVRYHDYLEDIHGSGVHLLGIINDILDLSKAEAGRLELHEEALDPSSLVRSVERLIRHRAEHAGLTLRLCLPSFPLVVHADERLLKQVVLNLVSNAVKFTPRTGCVTVSVALEETGCLSVTVADTGIGIAGRDLEKALEPFGQVQSTAGRQYEGTGLGLPIARMMMELHGGTLQLSSTEGVGTLVIARLPACRVKSQEVSQTTGATAQRFSPGYG
ncbi:hypothetical protein SAE02_74880 [Skermanella aerolata]|uniref:histidine kinase n=1 Tax=Skermanella aerolata TaxID=393310 RepID=A0A512E4D4_9PROT|nr:ATP-binding protein [Skermanella aerolata]GEO43340.1 hypothetical protein SAE02_74880 [Skermanella aerolata]